MNECNRICQDQLTNCCPPGGTTPGTTGGGSGSGAVTVTTTPEQQAAAAALLTLCTDGTIAGDADQDGVLTFEEYQQQLDLMTAANCPGVEITTTYQTEEELKAQFALVTCEMCYGVLDPYNLDVAVDGSYEECGCDDTTGSTASLALGVHTYLESVMYCLSLARVVHTRCQQPDKECADACVDTVNQCAIDQCPNLTEEEAPWDAHFVCLETCNPQYNPCIDQCGSVFPTDGTGSSDYPARQVPILLTFVPITMMLGLLL